MGVLGNNAKTVIKGIGSAVGEPNTFEPKSAFKDDGTVAVSFKDDQGQTQTKSFAYTIAADKSIAIDTQNDDGGPAQELIYLMEGTIASGKLLNLGIGYIETGKLETLSTIITNGDKWTDSSYYSVPTENNTK